MTLTTIQNVQQNHGRIMDVLRSISNLTDVGVCYDLMKPEKEPFIMLMLRDYLSIKDTKIIYDNAMTIQSITRLDKDDDKREPNMNLKLTYPFTNPFSPSQNYQSKYLHIEDGKSCDMIFLKYSETRIGDAFPSDYPGNKDQIYNVNFVVVNLSNGNQQQIWTVDPSYQQEILVAIQKFGPKLNVRCQEGNEEHSSRFYFEQIPLEHARPDEVV
jgi:hypothetical protein